MKKISFAVMILAIMRTNIMERKNEGMFIVPCQGSFLDAWSVIKMNWARIGMRSLLCGLMFLLSLERGGAQSYVNEPGIPAFTTAFPVEHGFINLANGNLHIEIPIADYPQRGNMKALHARLVYDSHFWTVGTELIDGGQFWKPSIPLNGVLVGGGFRLITDGEIGNITFSQSHEQCGCTPTPTGCNPNVRTTFSEYAYQEPNGTMHRAPNSFKLFQSPLNCPKPTVTSGTAYSVDNSGYKFVVTNLNVAVYAPNGTQVIIPPTSSQGIPPGAPLIQDANGNFYSYSKGQSVVFSDVVDTLGRTPVITSFSGNQVFLDYLCEQRCNPANGDRARVTLNMGSIQFDTHFNATFQGSGVREYSGAHDVLQSIVFPDGSSYQFQYDAYGQITSITLPTGGQITYTYDNFRDFADNVNRWVTSRTVDGNTWNFTIMPVLTTGCTALPFCQQVTVATPPYNDGTTTASDSHVYTFAVENGNVSGAFVTQVQYFRGSPSGIPVVTKSTDYGFAGTCPAFPGIASPDFYPVPIRDTLTWPSGSGTLSKKAEYCYDDNANLTVTKEWNYQPNGNFAATPDREVDNTYVADAAYISANILRLLKTTAVLDGNRTRVAQTTYNYDEGTPVASNVSTGHISVSGPRGNLTSIIRWLNPSDSTITTSSSTWFDTGMVDQVKDALQNPVTLSYDSTGAYATQKCDALSHCSYFTYDPNTGLLASSTDANGSGPDDAAHTTTYTYDSMWRPLCTSLPDGGQTCLSYPNATTVQKTTKIATGVSDVSSSILDTLGRPSQNQHVTPSGTAKVDTTYDPVGAVAIVSNPYFTTSDITYGVTQNYHDTLGRTVKTIKQDGSVASSAFSVLSSGSLNGICTTSTDEAGNQRSSCHNGFGEMIEVMEPGNASNGAFASGGVTISGALQTKSAVPAMAGTASVTFNGTEQSKAGIGAHAAVAGAGSVTIQGGEQSVVDTSNCSIVNHIQVCHVVYDQGTVSLTVNGVQVGCSYNQTGNATATAMASCLASAITNAANSSVTATASGATINLTARNGGASTNYSFGITSTFSQAWFTSPSYTSNPSNGNLTGGQDAYAGSTLYDSGTCTLTVNGTPYGRNFGQGDNANTIAAGLANLINAGSLTSATASGTTLFLTAKSGGAATNYSLSASCSYNSANFGGPSFTTSASGSSLTGGADASPAATDAGTVQMSVGGYSATANYGSGAGQDSTTAAVASDLVAKIQAQLPVSNPPFSISTGGANININWNSVGSAGNVVVSTASTTTQTSSFSRPSFASCAISASPQNCSTSLTGGQDPYGSGIAHPLTTLYTYDGLGNLTCVEQHGDAATGTGCNAAPASDATSPWRVRRFSYDSFSRLLTAYNPESGTSIYVYDNNGNLTQKVMPTPNQTGTDQHTLSYCYDALNRVTGKAYSWQNCQGTQLPAGTVVVSYTYDSGTNGIGHMTSLTDQAGSGTYNYDVLGRLSSETRTINGVTKTLRYSYNLDGSVATITYPSGAIITYTPDAAGRTLSAVDSGSSINYVTGAAYNASGALTDSIYGKSNSFTGIVNNFSFNNRLQPATLWSSSPVRTLMYLTYDFHLGNGDNGNVWGITNTRDTTRNQAFTYDPLNRLASAQNAGTDCTQTVINGKTKFWGNSYRYDAWGNLLGKTPTKCSAENLTLTANTNNQLQGGYTYDAAGNMTHDATTGNNYFYDPENRIYGAGNFIYTYDADGNRVEKANGVTPPTGTLYWYMTPGIVGESDLSGNLKTEYIFFDGERVARRDFPGNTVSYYFSDHLKTASVVTDATGTILDESDYYPWGGELQFANNLDNHYKFTGKERDSETGLDYFGARYYSNGLGRFITSDWAEKVTAVPFADFADPQSLNLYAYVRDIPTINVDSDGHVPDQRGSDWISGGESDWMRGGACYQGTGCRIQGLSPQQQGENNKPTPTWLSKETWYERSWEYMKEESRGVGDTTVMPIVNTLRHPILTVEEMGHDVMHPYETAENAYQSTKSMIVDALHGDPRALGQIGGLVITWKVAKELAKGREIEIGKNIRIAPTGNRTGHPTGRYPHYHRRGTGPGQGIGRHRPWEKKKTDTRFRDRF